MDRVTLYAAPLSYYSGKARAYLRWKAIAFQEVAPSPEVYRQVIIPAVGYPVIPVVVTAPGAVIQDTSDIIDYFEARATGPGLGPSVYPATPRQRLAALLLELYGDEWLLIPAMHYRWAYNRDWVLGEFGALVAPDAPLGERCALGAKLSARFQAMTPALGATPQTIPAIEASYEALLGELDAHFAHHPYLLGDRPSIGDYGLIGPLYAHLYRDPASGALMKRLAPHVADWVERVHNPPAPGAGDFLADDDIPDSLLPVLRRQMREQMLVLADTAIRLADWREQNPGETPPRNIGSHRFSIGDAQGKRLVIPHSQWMLQRPLTYYRSLAGADKAAADALLDTLGGDIFRAITIRAPLKREHNRLVFDNQGE
jgi:glutathione S-transferase